MIFFFATANSERKKIDVKELVPLQKIKINSNGAMILFYQKVGNMSENKETNF